MPFKRGAPLGNINRLTHGRNTRAYKERRAKLRTLRRRTRNLIIRAKLVLSARRALHAKQMRAAATERRDFRAETQRRGDQQALPSQRESTLEICSARAARQ